MRLRHRSLSGYRRKGAGGWVRTNLSLVAKIFEAIAEVEKSREILQSPVKIISQGAGHYLFFIFKILKHMAFFEKNDSVTDISHMDQIVT